MLKQLDPDNKNGGYVLPQELMRDMLDNACGNPYYPPGFDYRKAEAELREWIQKNPTKRRPSYPKPPGGWHVYRIETHCVAFMVKARKKRNARTKKYTWQILEIVKESC